MEAGVEVLGDYLVSIALRIVCQSDIRAWVRTD